MSVRVLVGDCRSVLATLPDESVHTCVTSPPYFGLRDYGHAGQIGLEPTPDEFVAQMVAVFREVRRVLRDDGTLWLNLGDSYAANRAYQVADGKVGDVGNTKGSMVPDGLKPKDLIGIPWRVAFALQADGWYLRQDIIWAKPNPMPESVRDRCTKSHEYLFLLAKSERYYYDADAVAEPVARDFWTEGVGPEYMTPTDGRNDGGKRKGSGPMDGTRNKRSVWTVATSPFSGAHFATFPPDLIEPCILASTSERGCCAKCGAPWRREVERTAMVLDRSDRTHELGRTRSSGTMLERPTSVTTGWSPSCACDAAAVPCTVLDPFGGAGTTGLVADRHHRNAILIELNPAYAEMARERIKAESTLFAEVA